MLNEYHIYVMKNNWIKKIFVIQKNLKISFRSSFFFYFTVFNWWFCWFKFSKRFFQICFCFKLFEKINIFARFWNDVFHRFSIKHDVANFEKFKLWSFFAFFVDWKTKSDFQNINQIEKNCRSKSNVVENVH